MRQMGILTRFKILGNSIMDVVQFHIALSLYHEFQADGVDAFEWWRDCASVVHFTAVHKRKVLEASVYMDDGAFYTFMEHVGCESADEEEEEEEEEEETDEEESSDEEYEPDESDVPLKRQRRD